MQGVWVVRWFGRRPGERVRLFCLAAFLLRPAWGKQGKREVLAGSHLLFSKKKQTV